MTGDAPPTSIAPTRERRCGGSWPMTPAAAGDGSDAPTTGTARTPSTSTACAGTFLERPMTRPLDATSANLPPVMRHVRGRHVLGHRDAQRARELPPDPRALDPMQLFDAALDRAGVDEHQRLPVVHVRAARKISPVGSRSASRDPDVSDREQR